MNRLRLELPAPATGRLLPLDELKGLAILLVILYHAGGVLAWANILHGDVGVDIFVIISGIGLTLSRREEPVGAFLRRRFWRIYPAYWIVLTIYVVANTHFLQLHYPPSDVILHYLGIQAWFGDGYGMSINDSFWFVTLIVSLYALYDLLKTWITSLDGLLLAGAACSLVCALGFFYTGQGGMYSHVALRLPGFFLGLLIGQLLRAGALNFPLTAAAMAALLLLSYVPYTQGIVFSNVGVAVSLMGAYVWIVRPFLPAAGGLALRFLGEHSLEIFLIHQPLIRQYNLYLHGRWLGDPSPSALSMSGGMAIGLVVTLFVSAELHRLLQRFLPRFEK